MELARFSESSPHLSTRSLGASESDCLISQTPSTRHHSPSSGDMESLSSHNNLETHEEETTALKRQFAKYAKYGRKFDRAVETVVAGGVKEHRFLPSKRKILTVVGNLGDEFIDPEKPYC